MPKPETIQNHKSLQLLGTLLHDPHIWHLTRHSVSAAFFIGLFVAFIPVPTQMLLAAFASIPFRANLPIAVGLVWVTNPLTIPPMFYGAYQVGAFVLGRESNNFEVTLSWEWFTTGLAHSWQPFLLGCLICGLVAGTLGSLVIRGLWRLHVVQQWNRRNRQRRELS